MLWKPYNSFSIFSTKIGNHYFEFLFLIIHLTLFFLKNGINIFLLIFFSILVNMEFLKRELMLKKNFKFSSTVFDFHVSLIKKKNIILLLILSQIQVLALSYGLNLDTRDQPINDNVS